MPGTLCDSFKNVIWGVFAPFSVIAGFQSHCQSHSQSQSQSQSQRQRQSLHPGGSADQGPAWACEALDRRTPFRHRLATGSADLSLHVRGPQTLRLAMAANEKSPLNLSRFSGLLVGESPVES